MSALRIVIVTGIYPPDIGGPATHARDISDDLTSKGHNVTVVSLTDGPSSRTEGLVRFSRRWPWQARFVAVVGWLVVRRGSYDVVYSTGMQTQAVIGAKLARRPVVVKVVGDPAWERGRRLGLVSEFFDEFQATSGQPMPVRAMQWCRTLAVTRADVVTVPSAYLAGVVDRWTGEAGTAVVVPNGVRLRPFNTGEALHRAGGLQALYVGRLVEHKRIGIIIEAVADTSGVTLDVIGEGPERNRLAALAERAGAADRVRLFGPCTHDEVLRRLREADVLVTAASYEGLPHTVLEALTQGTPVVASSAGGTTEAVVDGVNGMIVDPPTTAGFARALALLRDDPEVRTKLAQGAAESGQGWSVGSCTTALLEVLRQVAPREARPRVVFVGPTVTTWPPGTRLKRKIEILSRYVRPTLVMGGPSGIHRAGGITSVLCLPTPSAPPLRAAVHYLLAPMVAVLLATGRRPAPVVCQSPYEAFGVMVLGQLLPRPLRPPVVVEVHGDWRTATRMYGSSRRRLVAQLADRIATWSIRRADRVRVVSRYTEGLVVDAGYRGCLDRHVAFPADAAWLTSPLVPLPASPQVAFVGALEPCKAPDVLIQAWKLAQANNQRGHLVIAGAGQMERSARRQINSSGIGATATLVGHITRPGIMRLLDDSWFLVLPSRSEGLPLVVIEAMARGRPVVGSSVGGIPELVEDEVTGLLVPPDDARALAKAITRLLDDPRLVQELGQRARAFIQERDPLREFEDGVVRLANWSLRYGVARS